jgi:hypothetical protein
MPASARVARDGDGDRGCSIATATIKRESISMSWVEVAMMKAVRCQDYKPDGSLSGMKQALGGKHRLSCVVRDSHLLASVYLHY